MVAKIVYRQDIRTKEVKQYVGIEEAANDSGITYHMVGHQVRTRSLGPLSGYVFRYEADDFPTYTDDEMRYMHYLGFPLMATQQKGVIIRNNKGEIIFIGDGNAAAKYFGITTPSEVHRGIKAKRLRYRGAVTVDYPMGQQQPKGSVKTNITRDLILKHWKPMKLRAFRLSKGLSLDHIAEETGLTKAQINGWELGTRFDAYKNKKLIYNAYGIYPEDLEPSVEEVNRIEELLTKFSVHEIQIALDLQVAEERCKRFDETRQRAIQAHQESCKAVIKRPQRLKSSKDV